MQVKTCEIGEDKIEQAVRYAVSNRLCLTELSKFLVMEGGVDLDTLSRIIRENRGDDYQAVKPAVEPQPLHPQVAQRGFIHNWIESKIAS